MRILMEDAADHYLEDPDNEERIKKAIEDAEKLADKPLSTSKRHWMIDTGKGDRIKYLSSLNGHYTYNKSRAMKMTGKQASASRNIINKKFKINAKIYPIDNL